MNDSILKIKEICRLISENAPWDIDDLISLINIDEDQAKIIFEEADRVREQEMGNQVHLRGLIEFSNYCIRKCLYCGLRSEIKPLNRYRMSIGEIVDSALTAEALGYRSVVLQSGEDPFYTADKLAELVYRIKTASDLAVTLSCGEFSHRDYKQIKASGADRYLLRFETADSKLYRFLHPDSELDKRLECLQYLKDLEYQIGTGFMVGLPGETPEIMAENLLLLKEFDVDMAGIGPFIPNPQTPLSSEKGGTLLQALKAIALARLILRNAHIPATTAMGTLDPQGRQKALKAGANVVMPNVTPMQYREMYQLYPNKICLTDDPGHCRNCITGIIHSLGRSVATDHGHTLKKK
ncbi:MAG TPA: [FeFe] hydrogenase H-cluster radical SAM maturase HydE [Clostridia bacterium]|nr:[FeFe] hydrogenase H-cluster radical SAM maturase HydE [Clostridia bacterium]